MGYGIGPGASLGTPRKPGAKPIGPGIVPESIRSVQEIRLFQFQIVTTDIIINCPVL